MSRHAPIRAEDNFFIGEQKYIEFPVYDSDEANNLFTIPGGWTLEWVLRRGADAATAEFTITDADIERISMDNTANDNGVRVSVSANKTASLEPDTYFHTLRRSDPGNETVLSFGPCVLKWAATR